MRGLILAAAMAFGPAAALAEPSATEQLLAVDAMNDALAYAFGKKILEAGRTLPKAVAADPLGDLKSWAA